MTERSPHSGPMIEMPLDVYEGLSDRVAAYEEQREYADEQYRKALAAEARAQSLEEQYEVACRERDEYLAQRDRDYARFTEAKQAVIAADSERVRLQEQFETYREFFLACEAVEEGVVSFDLHGPAVERLRAARQRVYDIESNPASKPYCTCPEGADGNPCAVCGKPEAVTIPAISHVDPPRPTPEVWKCANCGSDDGPHFDRSLCACGSMHYFCNGCGEQDDPCDPDPASEPEGT